jgi:tRNA uridine 5-carboxymethylaminomethyl modification enzyme
MRDRLDAARRLARSLSVTPNEGARHGLEINKDGIRRSAYELLAHADMDVARLAAIWPELGSLDAKTVESLETEARYSVYLDRQAADVVQLRREENSMIPSELDFDGVPGLSNELKQKMRERRPRSVADAQRMEGMTPAALAVIVSFVRHAESGLRKGAA